MPNGIEHDARAAVIHELFVRASVESGARIRSGTTIPVKSPPGATPERRHPDAHLYLDPMKIERLRLDRSDPVPTADIVVQIDWSPIAPDPRLPTAERLRRRRRARKVWTWERDGDSGHAGIHVLTADGYQERMRSAMVPAVRVADLDAVLNEADEERRMTSTSDLAHRIPSTGALRPPPCTASSQSASDESVFSGRSGGEHFTEDPPSRWCASDPATPSTAARLART